MDTQTRSQVVHVPGQLSLPIDTRMHPCKAAALARRIRPGWQTGAACVGAKDPDAWFPHDQAPADDLADPLSACARCPVRRSCLAVGLLGREHGIWAGTLEPHRLDALAELSAGARVDDVLDDLLDAAFARASTDQPHDHAQEGSAA